MEIEGSGGIPKKVDRSHQNEDGEIGW